MTELNLERQQSVLKLLQQFQGTEPLKQLFWSELNYDRVNTQLSRRGWADAVAGGLADDPLLLASGANDFHVIYSRLTSDQLLMGLERPVVSKLLKDHPYALFLFSNSNQDQFHFLNVKYDDEVQNRRLFRRITVGPHERLRTASERIALLDLAEISSVRQRVSPLDIQQRHDDAFDVEQVTEKFFRGYVAVFDRLQEILKKQTKDARWAHDYSLQFLNRLMFLYFVQRKLWLNGDSDFLGSFWKAYKATTKKRDTFLSEWLSVLFFNAFNNNFHGGFRYFPEEVKAALQLAPYLNGGLFRENEIDQQFTFVLPDEPIRQTIDFFDSYNFTILEDAPLDKEVAVDPEMIGKVYESLVNVLTETDERGDAGIFYTARTEIDLMCRLAIIDSLSLHLGPEHKPVLNELLFALEPDERTRADAQAATWGLWERIDGRLRDLTVVDPACGSGSFLVGMLYVLSDLQERANLQLRRQEDPFERKKRIIGQSLYGVNVMDWAVHVAELRLWLALIIDANMSVAELHVRREPLLPHFSFKVRAGDSLVDEVGGLSVGRLRAGEDMPHAVKSSISRLKKEKLRFYNNDLSCAFRTADEVKKEELRLFREILDNRIKSLQDEIKSLRRKLSGSAESQIRLDGSTESATPQMHVRLVEWQKREDSLKRELDQITSARQALKPNKQPPFVWDIAFVEIFEGDKGGFDIVVGNPPYVRVENISDPHLNRENVDPENRKKYREKLALGVYETYPEFFGLTRATGTAKHRLAGKNDLYVYFYFQSLGLLNSTGTLSFITSNSWLDVGYGSDLQEFLVSSCRLELVIDNQVRRSFSNADINTAITVIGAPDSNAKPSETLMTRFVMFSIPFVNALRANVWTEVSSTQTRATSSEFRVHPITQATLLADGLDHAKHPAVYVGNKWGGKYLRAPDIYWRALSKGRRRIKRLGDLCEVEGYIHDNNTGPDFPKVHFLKSVKDVDRIALSEDMPGVKRYGVKDTGNSRLLAPILFARTFGTRHLVLFNQGRVYCKEFYKILPKDRAQTVSFAAQLNSTFSILQRELIGLVNLGDGALKFSGDDLKLFFLLEDLNTKAIEECFLKLANRPQLDLERELKQDDRRDLDAILFDALGLTAGEREDVYDAVLTLVNNRLKKAETFR